MAGNAYTVFLTLLARQERDDIVDWYVKQIPVQAGKWLDAFDELLSRLENNPFQYAEHLLFVRRVKFRLFPYHVFFAVDDINHIVEIIGIQHISRDPGIIRRRINF